MSTTTTTEPVVLPPMTASTKRVPPPARRRTVLGDFREIFAELRSGIDLLQQLTLRDIRIRYKQAVFGFAWALLIPAAVVLSGLAVRVAFAYVSKRHMDMHQIAAMAIKAVPWAFFVGCLNSGTQSLISNKSLVTKVYFPREVLPLSAVAAQTFDSTIGFLLVALIVPFLGVVASLQMLWVPLLLLMLWTLSMAAALFLSCANLFFRDVKYLVQVFLSFGIFITPVIFDAQMYGPIGSRVMMLNPVAPILEGLRLSIVYQENLMGVLRAPEGFVYWHPFYLLYSAAWSFGGLLVAMLIFHRAEQRFAEVA